MSKNSISGGRIWILPFVESIRELHALFPLGRCALGTMYYIITLLLR